ncbi:hypothetical protein D3C72_579650 [compost metagenome]
MSRVAEVDGEVGVVGLGETTEPAAGDHEPEMALEIGVEPPDSLGAARHGNGSTQGAVPAGPVRNPLGSREKRSGRYVQPLDLGLVEGGSGVG